MKTIVLITSGLTAIIFAILWYFDIVSEPVYTIVSAIVAFVTLLFPSEKQKKETKVNEFVGRDKVVSGDIVYGGKVDGGGDLVHGDKINGNKNIKIIK
jgi:hypothetical protein